MPGSERDLTGSVVLAVDGGNSKTDLALVRDDGRLLAHVRGPLSSPHHLGLEGALATLERMLDDALAAAGRERTTPVVDIAQLFLAGVDFPAEEELLRAQLELRRFASHVVVGNDTLALLRAGTERGWGVAVVCGAGINCVGVAPDGRTARWPALGAITGDWGGGYDVGLAALSAAARSADGRGPRTVLERTVGAHFGMAGPAEVGQAIHEGRLGTRRLVELAPHVLALSEDDAVAGAIAGRLAGEVVAFARVAIERLALSGEAVDVVLGGGLLRPAHERLVDAVARGLAAVAPRAEIRLTADPPIVGAALLALDAAGRGNGAHARAAADDRLRAQLGAAVRNEEAGRAARLAAAGAPVAEARIEAELELGLGLGSGGARHDG